MESTMDEEVLSEDSSQCSFKDEDGYTSGDSTRSVDDVRLAKQVMQDASNASRHISGAVAQHITNKDSDVILAQFIVSKLKQLPDEVCLEAEKDIVKKLYDYLYKSIPK